MKKGKLPEPEDFTQVAETQETDGCRSCYFFVGASCCGHTETMVRLRDKVEKFFKTDCGEDNLHYKLKQNGTKN